MILLKAMVEIAVCPMPHAAAELRPGIGVMATVADAWNGDYAAFEATQKGAHLEISD
jgi:hypothetical protein